MPGDTVLRLPSFRRAAPLVGVAALVVALSAAAWLEWRKASRDRARRAAVTSILESRGARLAAADRARLAKAVQRWGAEHDVDALLILAVIEQESHFDPRARGPRGGLGLMQVTPLTARHVASRLRIEPPGEEGLLEPDMNVRIGSAYLSELKTRFGSWDLALAAYNGGPTRPLALVAVCVLGAGSVARSCEAARRTGMRPGSSRGAEA